MLLITGAPGWLCDAVLTLLASKQIQARCLVQRSLPQSKLDAWRAEHREVNEVVPGDLEDVKSLEGACANLAGGSVLHAAGIIHPRRPSDWYRINRDGTLTLAKIAKAAGVRRFVYVSSNAAQGAASSRSQVLTESMPSKPLSHYGISKYQAEQGLLAMHQPGVFEVVIARPCMFYGPPVPARHVDIFKRIKYGRLPLVGGGLYDRSLSYVDDLAAGIILCLNHPRAAGEVFTLCDSRVYSTLEVCEAMAAALTVKPCYLRLPSICATTAWIIDRALNSVGLYNMPFHLLSEANWNVGCSNRKAAELLGFAPTVDIKEGYRRAVAWCREKKLLD